jgi:hypothetical protein
VFATKNGSTSVGDSKPLKTTAGPTRNSELPERVIKHEQSQPPYEPKAYKADETAAPRKDIIGNRLPKGSKEALL